MQLARQVAGDVIDYYGANLVTDSVTGAFINVPSGTHLKITKMAAAWQITSILNNQGIKSNGVGSYTVSNTLTLSDIGRVNYWNASSTGTLTLPATAVATIGSIVFISNINTGIVTIARSGTQGIYAFGAINAASISLGIGDSIGLVFDGSNWIQLTATQQPFRKRNAPTGNLLGGTRIAGTTYTNTNRFDIMVIIRSSNTYPNNGAINFTIDGVGLNGSLDASPQSGFGTNSRIVSFIVGGLSTYSVTGVGLDSWQEIV